MTDVCYVFKFGEIQKCMAWFCCVLLLAQQCKDGGLIYIYNTGVDGRHI